MSARFSTALLSEEYKVTFKRRSQWNQQLFKPSFLVPLRDEMTKSKRMPGNARVCSFPGCTADQSGQQMKKCSGCLSGIILDLWVNFSKVAFPTVSTIAFCVVHYRAFKMSRCSRHVLVSNIDDSNSFDQTNLSHI